MKLSEEKAISDRSIHWWSSVFSGIISMPQSPPRPTKKASSQFRNLFPDELKQFELKDRVDFTKLKEISVKHKFCASIISFISENNLVI